MTGPDGLLKVFTKNVLETALDEEMTEHLATAPRDRESTFEPQIVKKRQQRLTDVGEIVLSLHTSSPK